jgi:hypothetical protein
MDKIIIEIECTNAAFFPDKELEIARILRVMADKLERGIIPAIPRDINGNKCGKVSVI